MIKFILEKAIRQREYWIGEIQKLSGNFVEGTDNLEKLLEEEINKLGISSLVDHLRLCGTIPECYRHDTSEEKLYSKYTDCLLSLSYKALGLNSLVLKERADSADVEVFAKKFSFVADAKSFRLSRTAKNQKDFKVQTMDSWKRGKPYAMVVCPIYQLPTTSSQIYQQATTRNVCIFSYSHLVLLIEYSEIDGRRKAEQLLLKVFKTISELNPSKNAFDYWMAINRTMLSFSNKIESFWNYEKEVAAGAILATKEEALTFLADEREKIMRFTHQKALEELIKVHRIDSKIKKINTVTDNGLLNIK